MTDKIYVPSPLELIQKIETVFASVKAVEKSLEQCQITDKYGMTGISVEELERLYIQAGEIRPYNNWIDIPTELIEKYTNPFFNMSNEEFAFYLPAYMRYVLQNNLSKTNQHWWECKVLLDVSWHLGIEQEYDDLEYLYSAMTNDQKKVILEFTMVVVNLSYKVIKDKDFFENGQKKFWHEYHLQTILRAKNKLFSHLTYLL